MKKLINLFLLFTLIISLSGCSNPNKQETAINDILTQKKTDASKTQITVLIKHAFSINAFEKAVEEKFPDIDIVQVGNYTSAMNPNEYVARLKNDDLTDIVMTWPLSFGKEYWDDRLLDLSSLPFTTKYNLSMLDSIAEDGKLYYLPGPAQIRGLIYNKTLFEENGWVVPTNYNDFITLCKTIEASGIRAIQLGFENAEVLDTAFVGFGYGSSFATPKDMQWIKNYQNGNENFLDHFGTALQTFQDMVDAGIWQKADLEIDYSEREKIFFDRKSAMIEDSVLIARSAYKIAGSKDEFALMPFFNPGGEGNDWARLYMVCYIGLNKHLAEPQNKTKYNQVLRIMDYISTPEGQEALSADTGAMYSSLKSVEPPSVFETQDIVNALSHGRYAIFPELAKVQSTLREGLSGIVNGTLTIEQVGEMVDTANKSNDVAIITEKALGTATETFSLIETGNFITDTMRKNMDSEIALFLDSGKDGSYNNKGVTAKLYAGEIHKSDVQRIMPDFKYGEKGEIWKVTMTGENLLNTLEYAIPVDNNQTGWFYYFSGLKMNYNPTNEPGTRIKSISLGDGTKIDSTKIYSLAVTENSVPEEYIITSYKTGVILGDLLIEEIQKLETISPAKDTRFTFK